MNLFEKRNIYLSLIFTTILGSLIGYFYFLKNTRERLVFGVVIFMILVIVLNIYLYIIVKKQKNYYKNIINTSNNIVLVNDKKSIIYANKTFFKYFSKYKTLEDFKAENTCICNFFLREEGYLDGGDIIPNYIDTLIKHPEANYKVKIKIDKKIYYFVVNASLISHKKNHYSVIFSDITQEELYKHKLKLLNIKDTFDMSTLFHTYP